MKKKKCPRTHVQLELTPLPLTRQRAITHGYALFTARTFATSLTPRPFAGVDEMRRRTRPLYSISLSLSV